MSDRNKKSLACIDNMTLEDARRELASGTFGDLGSSTHSFALQWVLIKEVEERDKREADTLDIAKDANRIASDALVIARKNERWAMYAVIIAILAAIIATMAYIKTP